MSSSASRATRAGRAGRAVRVSRSSRAKRPPGAPSPRAPPSAARRGRSSSKRRGARSSGPRLAGRAKSPRAPPSAARRGRVSSSSRAGRAPATRSRWPRAGGRSPVERFSYGVVLPAAGLRGAAALPAGRRAPAGVAALSTGRGRAGFAAGFFFAPLASSIDAGTALVGRLSAPDERTGARVLSRVRGCLALSLVRGVSLMIPMLRVIRSRRRFADDCPANGCHRAGTCLRHARRGC